MSPAFIHWESADSLNYDRKFRSRVIGQYLYPARRQLPPYRCRSAEADVLLRLAKHFALNSLGRADRPENGNKEAFFMDGQEVQAGTGIDNRPETHLSFLGAVVSCLSSSAAPRSSSSAARSTCTSGNSAGSAHAIGRSAGVTPASSSSVTMASRSVPRSVAIACAGNTPST